MSEQANQVEGDAAAEARLGVTDREHERREDQPHDGVAESAERPLRRGRWRVADEPEHRDALLRFWISGEYSSQLPNTKPWLFFRGAPGTRPWAWWWLEKHPPIGDDESEDEYLTRTRQWLPGERDLFEAVEREPEPDDDDADITDR